MSVFNLPRSIPVNVKDFIIERLKKGDSYKQVVNNTKKIFGITILLMSVCRARKHYIEQTGEYIPNCVDRRKEEKKN